MSESREWLQVKNWEKFQHYGLRTPPWIKLYRSILSDYMFCALSDTNKAHLILIWLEASHEGGCVPNDANFLRRRLSLQRNPDLELFINQGWLIKNASKTLAHDASIEKNRIEKKKEEKKYVPVDNSRTAELRRKIGEALQNNNPEAAKRLRSELEKP